MLDVSESTVFSKETRVTIMDVALLTESLSERFVGAPLPKLAGISMFGEHFFFFCPPADGEKFRISSPHFHVFSYASCVYLTQFLSQPNASWRTLRVPL